jgi:hypothetical protein
MNPEQRGTLTPLGVCDESILVRLEPTPERGVAVVKLRDHFQCPLTRSRRPTSDGNKPSLVENAPRINPVVPNSGAYFGVEIVAQASWSVATILEASNSRGFGMFLVHPRGRDVWRTRPPGAIRPLYPLDDVRDMGESVRPLSSTFRNDRLSHQRLMAFFNAR